MTSELRKQRLAEQGITITDIEPNPFDYASIDPDAESVLNDIDTVLTERAQFTDSQIHESVKGDVCQKYTEDTSYFRRDFCVCGYTKNSHRQPATEHVTGQGDHTPTPWVAVFDKNESRISPEWGQFRLATLGSGNHAVDAAYIVHCVNQHSRLVSALRIATRYIKGEQIQHAWVNHPNEPTLSLGELLDEALANEPESEEL